MTKMRKVNFLHGQWTEKQHSYINYYLGYRLPGVLEIISLYCWKKWVVILSPLSNRAHIPGSVIG